LTTVRAARECPGCESPRPAERRGSTERERRNSRMLNSFRGKSERRRLLHSKAEADEHTMKLQQNTGSTRAATASVGTRRLATHYSHTSSSLNSRARRQHATPTARARQTERQAAGPHEPAEGIPLGECSFQSARGAQSADQQFDDLVRQRLRLRQRLPFAPSVPEVDAVETAEEYFCRHPR
jgi:hypothetical protein